MSEQNTAAQPTTALFSPIEKGAEGLRSELSDVFQSLKRLKNLAMDSTQDQKEGEDRGEVIANITLAMRHTEDARMRLGKVFEAREGKSNSTR